MKLDFVEKHTLRITIIAFFFIFVFYSLEFAFKILILGMVLYFLILFSLCAYWAKEWHPERMYKIGFLVSVLHTFIFLLGGTIGLGLGGVWIQFWPIFSEVIKSLFAF